VPLLVPLTLIALALIRWRRCARPTWGERVPDRRADSLGVSDGDMFLSRPCDYDRSAAADGHGPSVRRWVGAARKDAPTPQWSHQP